MSDPAISAHFTFAELTHTHTGLPNVPNSDQLANLQLLAATALEPTRLLLGPLQINSSFRTAAVNAAVGSTSKHSAHLDGLAADIDPLCDIQTAFAALRHSTIPFDQLIDEGTWIHISIPHPGTAPRRQCLIAVAGTHKRTYKHADA